MENKTFRWCFIGTGRLAHQVAAEITKSGRHLKDKASYEKALKHVKSIGSEWL